MFINRYGYSDILDRGNGYYYQVVEKQMHWEQAMNDEAPDRTIRLGPLTTSPHDADYFVSENYNIHIQNSHI